MIEVEETDMDISQGRLFLKGYIEGYHDGLRDGALGKTAEMVERDAMQIPIKMMEISTRGQNCLIKVGCSCVADVAALNDDAIMSIRNLGKKTASEIAYWLIGKGITNSAWTRYL